MKLSSLICFFAVLLLSRCKKDDAIPEKFTLVYPVDTTSEGCCIKFQWETQVEGEYSFVLSDSANFNHAILDTTINSAGPQEYLYNGYLVPARTYYWRLKQGQLEETASFIISDSVLFHFEGEYIVQIRYYIYRAGIGLWSDTTYQDEVYLAKVDDAMEFQYGSLTKMVQFDHFDSLNQQYIYKSEPGRQYCDLTMNLLSDSIFVYYVNVVSPGGTKYWDIRGKK